MTTKRGNNEGSIYFDKRAGAWVAKVTKDGRRKQKTGRSKKHAQLLLQELQQEDDTPDPATSPRLDEHLDWWLEKVVRHTTEDSTYRNYKSTVKNHIKPTLGKARVARLSAIDIDDWLIGLAEAGVGLRTRENAYKILRASLERARRRDLCLSNACDAVDKPAYEPDDIWPFTVKEAKRILKAASGGRLAGAIELGMRLGPRGAELFGLQWRDFDQKRGTLQIVRQAAEVHGRIHVKKLKTKAGRRRLDLDDTCVAVLVERQKHAMKEGLAGGEWIFPNRNGDPMRRSNFGARHWRPLLKKLGISHRGFHHCRHTAASHMLLAGVPLPEVSHILGHSKVSITADIYAHYMPGETRSGAETMTHLLGRVGGSVGG